MEVTFLGYILIPVTVIVAVIRPNWLFPMMVFFAPFQASAVINFSSVTFGLQPSYMIGMAWIVFVAYELVKRGKVTLGREALRPLVVLTAFVLWVALSALLMPSIFAGDLSVLSPEGQYVILAPSRLNLSQTMYVLFLWVVFVCTLIYCGTVERVRSGWRAFIMSSAFVVFYGLYQFLGHYWGMPLPIALLHNNCGFYLGYGQVIGQVKRVSSVLGEPSMCAFFLVASIGSLAVFMLISRTARLTNLVYLCGALLCLLLTFSTTGYATLALWAALAVAIASIRFGKVLLSSSVTIPRGLFKLAIAIGLVLVIGSATLDTIVDREALAAAVRNITVEKTSTYSAQQRGRWNALALELFEKTHGLGVGWGSNRASSMFLNILSNLGILGMVLFGLFIFEVVRAVWSQRNGSEMAAIAKSLCIGWLMMLTAGFIAVPDITTFMFFWLVPALALAAAQSTQFQGKGSIDLAIDRRGVYR